MLAQSQSYVASLPAGVQRGWYEGFNVALDDPKEIQVGADVVPGRFAAVALRVRGEIEVSLFYVYLVHGQLVKVRSTVSEAGWQTSRAGAFTQALVERLHAQH